MSIEDEIRDRCRQGLIHRLAPRSRGDHQYRTLLLTDEHLHNLQAAQTTDDDEARMGALLADLEVFITRRWLAPDYLFGLSPHNCGVWEIRSRMAPQMRVFGMFAAKDTLLATHYEYRAQLGDRSKGSWRAEILRAQAHWNRVLAPYQPIKTGNVNDVITGAMDEKYFKD